MGRHLTVDDATEADRVELEKEYQQSALLFKGTRASKEPKEGKKTLGLEDFKLVGVVGQGRFGKVWKVTHGGYVFAMKAIRKDYFLRENMFGLLKTERTLLASIRHPFITRLKYAFQTPQRAFLVMDYIGGGQMGYHFQRDPRQFWCEERVRLYAAQLVLALEHLHSLGVLHRDLKIDNVMFDDDGHAILIDLGLAKRLPNGMEKGSPEYAGINNLYFSPEMLRGESFGLESDWWALGVLVYALLMGSVPFPGQSLADMQAQVMGDTPIEIPEARQLSYACTHFLQHILAKPLDRRLRTAEALKAHSWFADLDWDAVYQRRVPMPWKPPPEDLEDLVSTPSMSYCGAPPRDVDLHNFSFAWNAHQGSDPFYMPPIHL